MSHLLNHPFFKKKKNLLIFLGSLNTFCFVGIYFYLSYAKKLPHSQRSVAQSYFPAPSQSEKQFPNIQRFSHFSKSLSAVRVEIRPVGEIPENGADEVTLEGSIIVNQTPPNGILNYEWHGDDGVEWVDGSASDQLYEVKAGDLRVLRATVRGFGKEFSRVVRLEVKFDNKDVQVGNSAIVHTRPEDSFEFVAPAIKMQVDREDREKLRGLASEADNQDSDFRNSNNPSKLKKIDNF